MNESRKQFQKWWEEWFGEAPLTPWEELWYGDGYYAEGIDHMWDAWQASREALDIELTPAYWITYYSDTDEHQYRAHSESGPESCARRIASEIGGYVVPVYHGKPQNCAAGIKVKG